MQAPAVQKAALILCFIASCFTPHSLSAQDPEDPAAEEPEQPGDWQIIPFALPFGSSDIGSGALANVILTNKPADGSGENIMFLAGAATDTGLNILFANGILKRSGGWRYSYKLGLIENPRAAYFGPGNFQNLPEIDAVREGRAPTPANSPVSPNFIRGRDASLNRAFLDDYFRTGDTRIGPTELNPGEEILRQKQNRYYDYYVKRQVAGGAIQKQIGTTALSAKIGFNGARTRIHALGGDREKGEPFPNSPTLLELEQPIGYDASRSDVFSNAAVLGVEYNTLPPERDRHPNQGMRSGIRYEGAGKATGSHYTFGRALVYHHNYLDLFTGFFGTGGRELVFAYRAFATQTFEDIPFFEERGLGGSALRGYPGNQFVDRVQMAGSIELRFTAFPSERPDGISIGFLVFVDSGRVAPTWRQIDHDGWHNAAGGGVNVIIGNRFVVELAGGASRYERFITLSVGHTFALRD